MKSKTAELLEAESRMTVSRGLGDGRNVKMSVKEYKFPAMRWIRCRDLKYSMVIVANNTVLYT